MSEEETVTMPLEVFEQLKRQADRNTTHQVNESADKIVLKTQVKRGDGTRDQDKIDVKVREDSPAKAAADLSETLDELEKNGIANTLRETQPGENE